MKNCILFFTGAFIFCFYVNNSFAQHREESNESFHPEHRLSVVISHAQVFEGRDIDGNRKVLTLPSWGLDYTYMFKQKWGIGLHTDIITETFEVEKHLESGGSGEVIERSRPIAPALMGIFKPNKHWSFLFGAGIEFAKEENFFLNRAGVEYGAELPRGWEVFGSLSYDIKWNAYDTWVLGLGISKVLGWKKLASEPKKE
jgi:hypothetical protein